jgi:hypothetical protein
MKTFTVVAIGVAALMISGPGAAAAGRPFGAFGEPQSPQQQAMERLREQQERLREMQERQQEMERQREEQQARQQEMERQRQEQQERQQEMERQREQQQQQQEQRQQEMERQREQQQQQQEQLQRQREQEQERQRAQAHSEPENRPQARPANVPQNVAPENHPYNNVQPKAPNLGANHRTASVARPTVISAAMRRAMTYNTRPGGMHINPDYFASHYGPTHGFHFPNYSGGACVGDCGLRQFNGEWYFSWNGGVFGLMGPMPGNWGFQTDYLYIDIGDDGNYYLYDAQFPDLAVQLTFVPTVGADQVGADEDEAD